MHIRMAIAMELCNKIKAIKIEDGYKTDVDPDDVHHWHIGPFEQKEGLEVINIKDLKVLFRDGYQILVVKIILGSVKGDNNYQFITNRMLDIYNCIENNYQYFLEKFGYWEVDVNDEDDLIIEQDDRKIAETAINLEITFKVEESFEVDNREF